MIRRIITALVAYIFIEFIVVGRPSYPTTSLDYFCPSRCHSRHCPLTTAIPFRLPARALPMSLSSHDHETQWISLADVNDTLYRSDDSEEDGWWVVLCYISCLILVPFHPHSSSSLLPMKWWSWGRSTRCMCHGNSVDDDEHSLNDGFSADAILAGEACSKHYMLPVRLLFRLWRWDSVFMLFVRSIWFAIQPTIN